MDSFLIFVGRLLLIFIFIIPFFAGIYSIFIIPVILALGSIVLGLGEIIKLLKQNNKS